MVRRSIPRPLSCLLVWRWVPVPLGLALLGIASCPADEDLDGWTSDVDCDDSDPATWPGAPERCDGADNDCDGTVDEGVLTAHFPDSDGDLFGDEAVVEEACERPRGYIEVGGDCDDSERTIHPEGVEGCDGVDNDCDGVVDEGPWPAYPDGDGDGFGRSEMPVEASCRPETGYVRARGDCDDTNAAVHPGAPDVAGDGVDQDCGGADGAQPSVALEASGYATIQAALDAASEGETVWIGPGTYPEVEVSFRGRALTLISTHGEEATIVQGGARGKSVMIFHAGEGPQSILDGFTIRGGRHWKGGGLSLRGASPTVRGCTIRENGNAQWNGEYSEAMGGGMYLEESSPMLERCTIRDNVAGEGTLYYVDAYAEGGGLYLLRSHPRLVGCVISGNVADSMNDDPTASVRWGSGESRGSGMYMEGSDPWLSDCKVSRNRGITAGNSAAMLGGGIYARSGAPTLVNCRVERNEMVSQGEGYGTGGGVEIQDAAVLMTNCLIRGNRADYGGGISGATYSDARETLRLENSILTLNAATLFGGGVEFNAPTATVVNSVVIANSAPESGGIMVWSTFIGGYLRLANVIVAYNDGYNLYFDAESAHPILFEISYSDLYNLGAEPNHNLTDLDATVLTVEPSFVSYSTEGVPEDLHLSLTSPLVDAGDNLIRDVDGMRSDIGAFGGPGGNGFDQDLDGYPGWFWPGTLKDAPAGFDPADYDRDDLDAKVH